MTTFATEFPIKPLRDNGAFVAQVFGWLRGTSYRTVTDQPESKDLHGDAGVFEAENGEQLRFQELKSENGSEAIGFRYDFPDQLGRLWRTETVLWHSAATDGQDLIRLRTQCIARSPGARLDAPRKPYLVKAILQDGRGGQDKLFPVNEKAKYLMDNKNSLNTAKEIMLGEATNYLPIVYISTDDNSNWAISENQIEKLAFDLGGIAHVVAEPSREFSIHLRDATEGKNAYGGTIAIIVPRRGIVKRFYLSFRVPTAEELARAVREASQTIRSQMPAVGWDWTDLNEHALRRQRERDRRRLSPEETEALYEQEILNLKEKNRELEQRIENLNGVDADDDLEGDLLPRSMIAKLGFEIYPGEFSDRLRLAARECLSRADQTGLDKRSYAVLSSVVENLQSSPALMELIEDLKRVTKDPRRMGADTTALLLRHGYQEKSDNRHIRLEAKEGLVGLDAITLAKTPGDTTRGLKNTRKQIENILGITKLSE